jgi:DNA-binding NarL/FixJ family response regulator
MDALERKQIGMLYRIEGRRLARVASATAMISRPSEREQAQPPSPRELAVLQLVADGFGNREIGLRVGVAEGTVATHLHHVMTKLEARNRAHAASIAIRSGLIR